MVKCIVCGVSSYDEMLHRTNPKGQTDAGWMCMSCIEKEEPELFKNIKSDDNFKVLEDIEEICLNKKKL